MSKKCYLDYNERDERYRVRLTYNHTEFRIGQYRSFQYALEAKRRTDIIIAQNLPPEIIISQLKNLSRTYRQTKIRNSTKPSTRKYVATLAYDKITYHLGDFRTKSDAESAKTLAQDLLSKTDNKSPENLMQVFEAIRQMGIRRPAKSTRTHRNEYDPLQTHASRTTTGIKGLKSPKNSGAHSKTGFYQLYIELSHDENINGGFYETVKEGTAAAFYISNMLNDGMTVDQIQDQMDRPKTLQDMAIKLARNQFRALGICKNDTDGRKMQIASPRIDTISLEDFNNILLQDAMEYEIVVLYNVRPQELRNPDLYISQIFEITT